MSWALEEAKKLIERYPDKEEYVIASGVSPSGIIHIGNFREIVTTYFVGKELENLGKKVRYILSFDNFDRLRKVPKGMPESYSKYIGMPYTSIPSPFSDKTYAKEMEDIFLEELKALDIYPEIISQTEQYKSGRYNKQIKLAVDERKKIFDILAKFKTQEFDDNDRDNYYPINIYCENCGKDTTKILNYNEQTADIEYECECNHRQIVNIHNAQNIKLHWKIDWPMRWKEEKVVFEPGGRDHSAENGSYAVSKVISKEIFGYEAPAYVAYDFIGLKGANGKMASSSGNVLSLSDLLSVYDKYIILWFYAKNKPSHQFSIALDEDVIRYYAEFDRMVKAYYNGNLDEKNASIISLIGVPEHYVQNPDFGSIANFLPMVNYKKEVLEELLKKENIDCSTIHFESRLLRATNWLEKYNNKKISVVNEFNDDFYSTLTEEEIEWIRKTLEILTRNFETTQELQNELYAVVKEDDSDDKRTKEKQKRYFQILYNMILGQDRGPKMGLLLSSLEYDVLKRTLHK